MYKFVITCENIIKSKQVGIIIFPLKNSSELIFFNIIYILKHDTNLISLGQLWQIGILYYKYSKYIVSKQMEKIIELAIKRKNLFIFNIQILGKIILVREKGMLIYLFNINL